MNIKKLFVGLSASLLFSVAFTTVITSNAVSVDKLKANADVEYTISFTYGDTFGSYPGLGGYGFTYTNARGSTFGFFKASVVEKNTNESALVLNYNQDDVEIIRSEYNSVEGIIPSINGLKSITIDYMWDYVYEYVGTNSVKLCYGFLENNVGNYVYEYAIEDNVTYDFGNHLPNCFKIVVNNTDTSHWYRFNIVTLTLTYSCSPSDYCKNEWLESNFYATPKNIERDGEDNIVSFESGAFPQSRADSATETYLEANYNSLTEYNGYYLYNSKLYARREATNTGYNTEYNIGDYYWFNVEPVKWIVISKTNDDYLVTSETALDSNYSFGNSSTSYTTSNIKTLFDNMYGDLFATNSIIKNNGTFNSKLYALTSTEYIAAQYEYRTAKPTAYARTRKVIQNQNENVEYWTNEDDPSDNRKAKVMGTNSSVSTKYKTDLSSVRPGMLITIE